METPTSSEFGPRCSSGNSVFSGSDPGRRKAHANCELQQKTVHLTFQTMNGLLDILVTISRIGATIDYVSAREQSAILAVSAKPSVIRRVPSLLRELVEVMEINEL